MTRRQIGNAVAAIAGVLAFALVVWWPTSNRPDGVNEAALRRTNAAEHGVSRASGATEPDASATPDALATSTFSNTPARVPVHESVAITAPASESAPTCVLVGRVTCDGAGAARALVQVETTRGGDFVTGETSTSGDYAIGGLSQGVWLVRVEAFELTPLVVEYDASAAEGIVTLDLETTRTRTVLVHVVGPDGQALATRPNLMGSATLEFSTEPFGARLAARDERNRMYRDLARRDPLAERQPHADPRVVTSLFVGHPGELHVALVEHDNLLATALLATDAELVTLVVDPERLTRAEMLVRLRVVDTDGAPLDAHVEVRSDGGGRFEETDADGRVEFERVASGWAEIDVRAPGRARERRNVFVERGQDVDLGDVVVQAATAIRGRVIDLAGRPRAVELRRGVFDSASGTIAWERNDVDTASDGTFAFEDLAPALHALRIEPSRAVRADGEPPLASEIALLDTRAGSLEGVTMEARPAARVSLRRRDRRATAFDVVAYDANGHEVGRCRCGGFRHDDELLLAPGRHELSLSVDGRELRRVELDVGAATGVVFVD